MELRSNPGVVFTLEDSPPFGARLSLEKAVDAESKHWRAGEGKEKVYSSKTEEAAGRGGAVDRRHDDREPGCGFLCVSERSDRDFAI
jgi:hypothetical protein